MAHRSRRRARRDARKPRQPPWQKVAIPYAPIEVLDKGRMETIHQASSKVLRDPGMRFLDAGARERLAAPRR